MLLWGGQFGGVACMWLILPPPPPLLDFLLVHRKFTCPLCNRSFTEKWAMNNHMKLHTGEKPYKCTWPTCHYSFLTASAMKDHYRTHTGLVKLFFLTWNGRGIGSKKKAGIQDMPFTLEPLRHSCYSWIYTIGFFLCNISTIPNNENVKRKKVLTIRFSRVYLHLLNGWKCKHLPCTELQFIVFLVIIAAPCCLKN